MNEHFYRETCRYLGYKGGARPDERTAEIILRVADEVRAAASPRSRAVRLPLSFFGEDGIIIGTAETHSAALRKNLKDCGECYLMAATLGVGADMLQRRYAAEKVSYAAICQAAAAALIEEVCDEKNEELRQEAAREGLLLRPRFSPGYGDFPLEFQRDALSMLSAPSKLGLTVTDSLMLAPTKSVTAVIGISKGGCTNKISHGCEECTKTDCEYRR